MPPRPTLPTDDLYARLEVPVDATPETIEVAWRALLKRHHPDVAGEHALEVAKRINVAHDWLSDADLRAHYDRERHPRARGARTANGPRSGTWAPRSGADTRTSAPAARPRPADPEEALRRFVDRVGRLDHDELDRLSVAEAPPIAFVASIRRFLGAERTSALDRAEELVRAGAPAAAWSSLPARDAILAAAHEIVLAPFLDEHLSGSYLDRARERLTRSWEAAIDQPRYGPNTAAVRRVVDRAAALSTDELRRLTRAAGRGRIDDPWPRGIDPAEDEVFRVSSELAGRDAAAAPSFDGIDRVTAGRARRVLRRVAHAHVLRHAFSSAEFAGLVEPWRVATGDPGTGRAAGPIPNPTVRRA
jgi:curved DNA-binding protein CbpA